MSILIKLMFFISWIFGVFPAVLPFSNSSFFKFSLWKNPNLIWSIILLLANSVWMLDSFLTVPVTFAKEHMTVTLVIFVGNGMAFLADCIIRLSVFWNCGQLIEFYKNVRRIHENLGQHTNYFKAKTWQYKSNGSEDQVQVVSYNRLGRIRNSFRGVSLRNSMHVSLMLLYLLPRMLYHIYFALMENWGRIKYSLVFNKNMDLCWIHAVKIVGCFLAFSHLAVVFFAYSFILLFGVQLTDLYERICEKLCYKEKDYHDLIGNEQDDYNISRLLLSASSSGTDEQSNSNSNSNNPRSSQRTSSREDEINMNKRRHERFTQLDLVSTDGKNYLTIEFQRLKTCFEFYSKLAGILIFAIALKMIQDIFTMLSYLIVANQRKFSKILWAVSSSLLFIQIINLGELQQTKISKWKDRILHSLLRRNDKDLTTLEHERKETAVEILGFNWTLTAMNLFTVNRRLLPGVVAMILSNIILIYQMKISDSSSNVRFKNQNSTCTC